MSSSPTTFAVHDHRHDDLGLGLDGARQVSRIGIDVVHHHGLSRRNGGAADALVQRNALVRRLRADVRAEHQHGIFARPALLDHVEADPVEMAQPFLQAADDDAHQVFDAGGSVGQRGRVPRRVADSSSPSSSIHITGAESAEFRAGCGNSSGCRPTRWRAVRRAGCVAGVFSSSSLMQNTRPSRTAGKFCPATLLDDLLQRDAIARAAPGGEQ